MPKPPEYPPEKEIGGPYEETNLEKEAIEPMSQGERINKLNELVEEYKEMLTAGYEESELEIKREEIFEKWSELEKILPKSDKARPIIEKKMRELGL